MSRVERRERAGARWLALAAGLGLLAAVGVTSAALVDDATVGLGADGIGFQGRFDVGVVLPDGTVEQADDAAGHSWAVAGAATLVPGRVVSTRIPVFNNTERLAADVTVTVVALGADGAVASGAPNITPLLRFDAVAADGTVLFSDVPIASASASLGTLASREVAALVEGGAYAPGADGSADAVTLTIRYPQSDESTQRNGGQAAIALRFDATSVAP